MLYNKCDILVEIKFIQLEWNLVWNRNQIIERDFLGFILW